MAVRDDFAAGEVLAAADLNDTFAEKLPYSYGTATPSTSVDGFLWYDENDTPPTPKFWDGAAFQNLTPAAPGLVLILDDTFSAVSSVTISDCFSSTYDDYLITLTANGLISAQLRTGATTANSNYADQFVQVTNTVYQEARRTAQSSAYFAGDNADTFASYTYMFGPALARATSWVTQEAVLNQAVFRTYNGLHTTATAYESLVLTVGTGTTSGTIRIYGLKNS